MRNTSFDELLDRLAERIADEVAARVASKLAVPPERNGLVDEPTMAEIAKVSQQSLQRRRKAGDIPFVQCGRRVLYRQADVIAALTSRKNGGDA